MTSQYERKSTGYAVAWSVNKFDGGVKRSLCAASIHSDMYVGDGYAWFAKRADATAHIKALSGVSWYAPHGTYGAPTYRVVSLARAPQWVMRLLD